MDGGLPGPRFVCPLRALDTRFPGPYVRLIGNGPHRRTRARRVVAFGTPYVVSGARGDHRPQRDPAAALPRAGLSDRPARAGGIVGDDGRAERAAGRPAPSQRRRRRWQDLTRVPGGGALAALQSTWWRGFTPARKYVAAGRRSTWRRGFSPARGTALARTALCFDGDRLGFWGSTTRVSTANTSGLRPGIAILTSPLASQSPRPGSNFCGSRVTSALQSARTASCPITSTC